MESNLNSGFSILMSVYTEENPDYLSKSFESLTKQLLPAIEVVLVQDGPIKPELHHVIVNYKDRLPFQIISLDKNQGLSKALNIGLEHCSNEWVARMDTDDICLPERLELQAKYIAENPSADIVGGFALRMDEDGNLCETIKVPVGSEKIRNLIWTCPMIHPTVCYRRDKILAVGGYNPDAGPRQDDFDLWFRCAAAGYEFHNIPQPLLLYRFTEANMRRNSLKVGYHRLKVGFRGNKKLGYGVKAYIGVMVPFFRAILPYPLNIWVYKLLHRFNPRNK
jgi:glycosyltransferase involved in cell wall biosynthesis